MKNLSALLGVLCLLAIAPVTSAQYDVSRINKKAVAVYDKAMILAGDGNLTAAVPFLQEAIKLDGKYIEAYLSLAGVYGQMKEVEASVATYEKAFALDSNYTSDFRL